MTQEQRAYPRRTSTNISIAVVTNNAPTSWINVLNISQGGALVCLGNRLKIVVGEVIHVLVRINRSIVETKAVVLRKTDNAVAIRFASPVTLEST